jgi:hypothetical protein
MYSCIGTRVPVPVLLVLAVSVIRAMTFLVPRYLNIRYGPSTAVVLSTISIRVFENCFFGMGWHGLRLH